MKVLLVNFELFSLMATPPVGEEDPKLKGFVGQGDRMWIWQSIGLPWRVPKVTKALECYHL
jgi:hypothetical protein